MKGKLPEDEGRCLFQQLIDGVSYCHEKGVYHRDLKVTFFLSFFSSIKIKSDRVMLFFHSSFMYVYIWKYYRFSLTQFSVTA